MTDMMGMAEVVEMVVRRLYWENKDAAPSVFNDGAVSLAQLLEELRNLGYIAIYIPGGRRDGETFYRPGDEDGFPFTEVIEDGEIVLNGKPIQIERVFSWHGGVASGHPTEDVRVRG